MFFAFVCFALAASAAPLHAEDTNSVSGTDLSSFDLITKRNIFDPNRAPHTSRNYGDRPRPVRIDSFTLVGTMDYAKGWFAFFDGTSYEYRKPLKPGDMIAGYRVGQIAPEAITLLAASNKTIHLPVGAQMRRSDNGPWTLMKHAAPAATASTPGEPSDLATKAATLNGAESDALKRLLLKRQNEK